MAITRGSMTAQINGQLRGARDEKKKIIVKKLKKKPIVKKVKVQHTQARNDTIQIVITENGFLYKQSGH